LAIVRGKDPDAALNTVRTLAEEGIVAVEVSLTTADALNVIRRARTELGPDAPIGAGTVRSAADAARAVDAGASYRPRPHQLARDDVSLGAVAPLADRPDQPIAAAGTSSALSC
jgi:2-keto-3-deoxy-6-phosphogluconate aldolase